MLEKSMELNYASQGKINNQSTIVSKQFTLRNSRSIIGSKSDERCRLRTGNCRERSSSLFQIILQINGLQSLLFNRQRFDQYPLYNHLDWKFEWYLILDKDSREETVEQDVDIEPSL